MSRKHTSVCKALTAEFASIDVSYFLLVGLSYQMEQLTERHVCVWHIQLVCTCIRKHVSRLTTVSCQGISGNPDNIFTRSWSTIILWEWSNQLHISPLWHLWSKYSHMFMLHTSAYADKSKWNKVCSISEMTLLSLSEGSRFWNRDRSRMAYSSFTVVCNRVIFCGNTYIEISRDNEKTCYKKELNWRIAFWIQQIGHNLSRLLSLLSSDLIASNEVDDPHPIAQFKSAT
jgi:hypothetical protein